jgi:type IV pilus assembly protein PilX
MRQVNLKIKQQGVTLVISILFLLILTILSVLAATNSSLELKMAGNMQDSYSSFQSAEAGAIATLSLAGTTADPFDGSTEIQDPFDDFVSTPSTHPLANVTGGSSSVTVNLTLTTSATACPRSVAGFSADLLACDHYDIQSNHDQVQKARTEVHLGAVKTFIGSPVL